MSRGAGQQGKHMRSGETTVDTGKPRETADTPPHGTTAHHATPLNPQVDEADGIHDAGAPGRATCLVGRALDRFCVASILLFLAVTTVASLVVTATMPHYTYAIELSLTAGPLVAAVAAAVAFVVRGQRFCAWLDRLDAERLMRALVVYIVVVGCAWVTLANVWPEWDSEEVRRMALDILARRQPSPDSYASRFQHQVPLAVLLSALIWVFGDASYQAFELLNVASVVATAYALRHLARACLADERAQKLTLLLVFPFLPLLFYCTFQYANLIALPLCVEALALQRAAFGDGDLGPGRSRYRSLGYGLVSIALACAGAFLKSSMVLVLVAMTVAWAVHALARRSVPSAALVAIALVAHLGCGAASAALSRAALGLDAANAMPKISWVAMGLQGGVAPGSYNPGWYNPQWMSTWQGDNYDTERIAADSRASISASLDQFAQRPLYALYFFAVKYCAEWCQPDYESLLASNWVYTSTEHPPMAQRPMSVPLHSIYYGLANKALLALLDCYQFLLVAFALAGAWRLRKRGVHELVPLLACAGTGLLYLFWEAQSQYVMHAYVLMIPYAAYGLSRMRRT